MRYRIRQQPPRFRFPYCRCSPLRSSSYSCSPDEVSKQRWIRNGKNIDVLYKIIDSLKIHDLVEEVKWRTGVEFSSFFQNHSVTFDVRNMLNELKGRIGFQMTRSILADQINLKPSDENTKIVAVSAYHSEDDFEQDQFLKTLIHGTTRDSNNKSELSNLCLVAQHYVSFPNYANREDILEKAINLASDEDFKDARQKFVQLARRTYKGKNYCERGGWTYGRNGHCIQ